jgi:organic hydroperoxide reductase OsmC/OhrA
MLREHNYEVTVEWCGNRGSGTSGYRDYGREYTVSCDQKPSIPGSSDPAFRGNADRWNPEDLIVAAVAACHKLWYLHLCSESGITVLAYIDAATGTMIEDSEKGDRIIGVVLKPVVTIRAGDDKALAMQLHDEVPPKCAIANSVNFAVSHEPVIVKQEEI